MVRQTRDRSNDYLEVRCITFFVQDTIIKYDETYFVSKKTVLANTYRFCINSNDCDIMSCII